MIDVGFARTFVKKLKADEARELLVKFYAKFHREEETQVYAEHTPGPWQIRYLTGTDMEIRAANYGSICKLSGLSHSVELMDEYGPTEVANAKLIERAPLLQEIIDTLENDNNSIPAPIWEKILELKTLKHGKE